MENNEEPFRLKIIALTAEQKVYQSLKDSRAQQLWDDRYIKTVTNGPNYAFFNQYGTKMSAALHKCKLIIAASDTNRIIVFSQYYKTLDRFKRVLDVNAIKYVICKGTVHTRTKAIRAFYDQSEIRIIMLSLENSASGTNLQEATHVMLLDPIGGTKEEQEAFEAQAIGRAHRQGQEKVSLQRRTHATTHISFCASFIRLFCRLCW